MISHMIDAHAMKIEPRETQGQRSKEKKSSEQAEALFGVSTFPWILPEPNDVEKESGNIVQLGENKVLQKGPDVLKASKSNDSIIIEKQPLQANQIRGSLMTKPDLSLEGIKEKITSVGAWLDMLKGKE